MTPCLAEAQYKLVQHGVFDPVGKVLAPRLAAALNSQVVVENRPGGEGKVAFEIVAGATDGKTFALLSSELVLRAIAKHPDVLNALQGVGLLGISAYLVVTPAAGRIRDIEDLRSLVRSRSAKWGAAGAGTVSDICARQITKALGSTEIEIFDYGSSGHLANALLDRRIDVGCLTTTLAKFHLERGISRALATGLPFRPRAFPAVPTLDELGISQVIPGTWVMLVVSRAAPSGSTAELATALRRVVAEGAITAQFEAFESIPPEDVRPDIAESFLRRQIAELAPFAKLPQ